MAADREVVHAVEDICRRRDPQRTGRGRGGRVVDGGADLGLVETGGTVRAALRRPGRRAWVRGPGPGGGGARRGLHGSAVGTGQSPGGRTDDRGAGRRWRPPAGE